MQKYSNEPPPHIGFQTEPPPYPVNNPQTMTTNVQQPTQFVVMGPVGPSSQMITCPSCRNLISTTVVSEATTRTHIMAALLCIFLCWPCTCLPYCMDSCKNMNHYCPSCKAFLGTYKQ